jgi:signal transduction histidine kinase
VIRTDAARPTTRALRLAALTTGTLVVASLLLRLWNPFGAPPPDPSDWVPHLWGAAAIVLVVLVHAWAPTLAWCALIVGSAASALGCVGLVREIAAEGDPTPPVLSALVAVALVVPPVIAAAYATADGRGPLAARLGAWAAAGALSAVLVGSFLSRTLGGERGGVPEWLWLGVIGALTAAGLARDLGPALVRTRRRYAAARTAGDDGPARPGPGGALSALRIFLDEVVPGREAGRAEAAESERGRLAADLHAEVLPSLRRALAEAEGGGTVERLAADLRTAVDEVEALLVARRSIVLEEMGLLAGLEWLAERTEDRSDVRVEILVEGDGASAGPGDRPSARPPRDVERAAFRVAQLALDNVVRHAPGASVSVRLATSAGHVRLRIEDDGDGTPIDEAAALRSGRRGIADMRAEARACDAAIEVGRGPGGRGTSIGFAWPAFAGP